MAGDHILIGLLPVPGHFQAVPFHRRTRGLALRAAKFLVQPTAQALRADAAYTAISCPPLEGTGTLIRRHAVPFQCITSGTRSAAAAVTCATGRVMPALAATSRPVAPTAHALRGDVPDTPTRPAVRRTAGLDARFQTVPFQCRMSVPRPDDPAAQASLEEITVTRSSVAVGRGLGL
jgi:hypothetical protein